MAIVSRGLGQPEAGAIVTGGLGASETDPNALHADIYGSSSCTAELTDTGGNELAATLTGTSTLVGTLTGYPTAPPPGGGWSGLWSRGPRPAQLSAHLYGRGALFADVSFTVNFDDIDIETLLLVDAF